MRNLNLLDQYRNTSPGVLAFYGGVGDDTCGMFHVPSPVNGRLMRVIASTGEGWDHVSVSLEDRVPLWTEMQYVHRLFFSEGETAMQLHVPEDEHIDKCRHCLHLWRPQSVEIPRPPAFLVA